MHVHVPTKITRETRRRRVSEPFSSNASVDRLLGGDTHVYIYEGRRFLYSFQSAPETSTSRTGKEALAVCKAQRLPCPGWKGYNNIFSSYEVENYLPLVVGDRKIEMKLLQRCCEAFVEYLRRYRARSQTWNIHNLNKNAKFSYT